MQYGTPPSWDECLETTPPDNLIKKTGQTIIPPHAVSLQVPEVMGQPAPVHAVARQLNLHFDFGSHRPVVVKVEGYGWFRIGPFGWAWSERKED